MVIRFSRGDVIALAGSPFFLFSLLPPPSSPRRSVPPLLYFLPSALLSRHSRPHADYSRRSYGSKIRHWPVSIHTAAPAPSLSFAEEKRVEPGPAEGLPVRPPRPRGRELQLLRGEGEGQGDSRRARAKRRKRKRKGDVRTNYSFDGLIEIRETAMGKWATIHAPRNIYIYTYIYGIPCLNDKKYEGRNDFFLPFGNRERRKNSIPIPCK